MTGTTAPQKDDGLIWLGLVPAEAEMLKALVDSGAFRVRNGQAILSFNQDGVMMTIEIRTNAYRRKTGA